MARAPGVRSIVREALKPGIKTREVTVKPRKKGKAEEPPAEEAPVSPEDLTPEPPATDAPVVVKPIEPLSQEATEERDKCHHQRRRKRKRA